MIENELTDRDVIRGARSAIVGWKQRIDQAERGEDVASAVTSFFLLDQREIAVINDAIENTMVGFEPGEREVAEALLDDFTHWLKDEPRAETETA